MRKTIFNLIAFAAVLTLSVSSMAAKSAKHGKSLFAVVVDEKTYEKIGKDVDAYVASVSNEGRVGKLVVDKWFSPDSIKAQLHKMYLNENLEGAVFVGDIPIPMLRDAQHLTTAFKMNQKADIKDSSVPSDRFYDDFDLKFKFMKQDEDKKLLFYYSLLPESTQIIDCDIYTARIKAPEGENKYELLAAYLRKAVAQKSQQNPMHKVLHFAGHGYNSEAMNARIDEALALGEHFKFLNTNRGELNFIDHTFDKSVKVRLMAALSDKELDLAILHHHGHEDVQYLNGSPYAADPKSWLDLAKNYFRGKMRSAKNPEVTKQRFMESYGIPAAWLDEANDPKLVLEDSIYAAGMDIYIPDLADFVSGGKMVILDACFNGAFNNDDYIAAHHIFNPGRTLVVKANSVNTLQDTWTTELIGLLNWGVSAGNWAKGQMTLESHLYGDPTFCYGQGELTFPTKKPFDINVAMVSRKGDMKLWREVLEASVNSIEACDLASLAIKYLQIGGAISSAQLLEIQKNSPSKITRLAAFNANRKIADENFYKAIALGLGDDYELTQRLSAMYAAKNFAKELLPYLVKSYMNPLTTARVAFQLRSNLDGFNIDELSAEFEKQHKENPYWKGDAEFDKVMEHTKLTHSTLKKEADQILDNTLSQRDKRFFIRARRNGCEPLAVDPLVHIIRNDSDKELRLTAAEALGWYIYSNYKKDIISQCETLYAQEKDADVKAELLKTINRLK